MKKDTNEMLNVAIYARVSTEHEAQLYALDNQVDWYNDILNRHSNWTLTEKYIDRGITGTSAKKRPNFLRMIEDAEKGEFDLIVTREVSRFARNTVDTLQYTRQLKKWDVAVYFVEDNIWTDDPDGELRLTIMATLAQDESRKTSLRVKAGQRASMEKGIYFQNGSVLGYDYDKTTRELTINEEQAETVRRIFDLYNSGLGVRKVQWELEKEGRKTALGSTLWSCSVISRTLKNKLYAGYLVFGKQYVPDFLEQKKVNNHGEREQLEVLGTHEPIITLEEWEQAQARLESHKIGDGSNKTKKASIDVWGRKLRCSCGSTFQRRQYHKKSETGKEYICYQCYNTIKSGSVKTREKKGLPTEGMCSTPPVTRWKLEAMAYYIFRTFSFNKDTIILKAEKMLKAYADEVDSSSTVVQAESYKKEIEKYNKKLDGLIDMRAGEEISKEKFREKKEEYEKAISELEKKIDELEIDDNIAEYESRLEIFKKALDRIDSLDETKVVPEYLIDAVVEYILVDGDTFKWKFRLLPDTTDLKVEGKREHTFRISDISDSKMQIAKCSTGSHTPTASLKKAFKIADFCIDKNTVKQCLNMRPQDRIHTWRDLLVELYI